MIETLRQLGEDIKTGLGEGASITRCDHQILIVVRRSGQFYLKIEVTPAETLRRPTIYAYFERMGENHPIQPFEIIALQPLAVVATEVVKAAVAFLDANWTRA